MPARAAETTKIKGPDNPTSYKQWLERYGEGRKDKGDGGGLIVVKSCMAM